MTSTKYIGMDVHMETKASMILQFSEGLRGELHINVFFLTSSFIEFDRKNTDQYQLRRLMSPFTGLDLQLLSFGDEDSRS
jgi:hypothetical protein